jgi:hypothetical protein
LDIGRASFFAERSEISLPQLRHRQRGFHGFDPQAGR